MVFFEPVGALGVRLARHLRTEVSELLAELLDFGLSLEVLECSANGRVGEADGDGAESAGFQLWMPLHDVERTLRREGVVVVMDTGDDLALLRVRVGGDSEMWTFDGCTDGFGGWCTWERDGRWVDESDGRGAELGLGGDDFDSVAEDGGVGLDG